MNWKQLAKDMGHIAFVSFVAGFFAGVGIFVSYEIIKSAGFLIA